VTPTVGSGHTVRLEATIQDPNGLAEVASAAVSIVDRKGRTLGSWSLADFAASGGVLQLVADVDLKGPGSFTATISATDSGGLSTSTSTIFAR
jgi:hypothetical protein